MGLQTMERESESDKGLFEGEKASDKPRYLTRKEGKKDLFDLCSFLRWGFGPSFCLFGKGKKNTKVAVREASPHVGHVYLVGLAAADKRYLKILPLLVSLGGQRSIPKCLSSCVIVMPCGFSHDLPPPPSYVILQLLPTSSLHTHNRKTCHYLAGSRKATLDNLTGASCSWWPRYIHTPTLGLPHIRDLPAPLPFLCPTHDMPRTMGWGIPQPSTKPQKYKMPTAAIPLNRTWAWYFQSYVSSRHRFYPCRGTFILHGRSMLLPRTLIRSPLPCNRPLDTAVPSFSTLTGDEEKLLQRLTAWALTATLFYILGTSEILVRLPSDAIPLYQRVSWNELDKPPYPSAVIRRGQCLSYNVGTQPQRINPIGPTSADVVEYQTPSGTLADILPSPYMLSKNDVYQDQVYCFPLFLNTPANGTLP
ncbi:conserved hypothetical protein [Microsporum canis CBS 113480]|uniref:Uncharacterized protein n=1 Tax=Arthroderma otae (strain ATCC MYA-4605 / CBS 113480) TaxID=554155 RepID=C5FKG7_ARTOC|nr:conserved hypothetical protein [Microsporum canis CBS 113480]EEQ30189.1 conserved hypothetical protein [Microsporum canis CBS 113480]